MEAKFQKYMAIIMQGLLKQKNAIVCLLNKDIRQAVRTLYEQCR